MAQVDYFLKIDGIDGESQDSKHKGEIELMSFSYSGSQAVSSGFGGGGGVGKVSLQDFHFTVPINKSSPKLFLSCCNGSHIKSAVLTCRKAGKEQQEFLKITMSDCIVSSYHSGGSGGSDVTPIDQISLNFTKLELEYKEQKSDGSLAGATKAGWDVKQNKAV
jgi:type VI secretion system secreted protein Hcp